MRWLHLLPAVFFAAASAAAADYPSIVRETPGLVGYWRFEEKSGSTVTDSAGEHYGRVELAQRAADGIAGGAIQFDGERSLIYLFRHPDLEARTGDFTIEFWCRPDELGRKRPRGTSYLLAHKMSAFTAGCSAGWYLTLREDGRLDMRIRETRERQIVAETKEPVISAGKWSHVAAVRKGNEIHLYVDGKSVAEGTGSLGVDARMYGDVLLGGSVWGQKFPGLIDEVAYYNVALPADVIEKHLRAVDVKP